MNLDGPMTNTQVPFSGYSNAKVCGSRHGETGKWIDDVGKGGLVKRTFVSTKGKKLIKTRKRDILSVS